MKTMNLCGFAAAFVVLPACVQQHSATVVVPPPAAVIAAPTAYTPAAVPQKKMPVQPAAKPAVAPPPAAKSVAQPAAKPAAAPSAAVKTVAVPVAPTVRKSAPAPAAPAALPPLRGTHSQVISPGDGVKAKRSLGGEKVYAN